MADREKILRFFRSGGDEVSGIFAAGVGDIFAVGAFRAFGTNVYAGHHR